MAHPSLYRYSGLWLSLILAIWAWSSWLTGTDWAILPSVILTALAAVAVRDVTQTHHAILRNYPLIGHLRFLFEDIRPEMRQYFFESDQDETPFTREARSLVYQRAKGVEDKRPFGTMEKVYSSGYTWLTHSMAPVTIADSDFRVNIGGPDCTQPYKASIYNISAMSFGALSANAISALNRGAALGKFAHDTGEGGISRFHREGGGDLIYQVASGYFGCRAEDGRFDPEAFARQAADPQIKMIELKISQGAKPGQGGMLPAAKITPEIAEARGIPMGRDCISPARHSSFSTPIEMLEFIRTLRNLAGGKPVGFKLCIGHRREFMCVVKAMIKTGITPDFIVVDGTEGGTGAAPLEFVNRVGMPMLEGLHFVHNTLRGAGLRDRIKVGAAGKVISAFDIARALALGADWCNSARGFMFALGCIQAQSCHTNRCPVGIATQDPLRMRALDVDDKYQRIARFHKNTLKSLAEIAGAAGLSSPSDFKPYHFMFRLTDSGFSDGNQAFPYLPDGFLLTDGPEDDLREWRSRWNRASADTFQPTEIPLGRFS